MCDLFRQQYSRIGTSYTLDRPNFLQPNCARKVSDSYDLIYKGFEIGGPGPDAKRKLAKTEYRDLDMDAKDRVADDLNRDVDDMIDEDNKSVVGSGLNLAGAVANRMSSTRRYTKRKPDVETFKGAGLIGKVRGDINKHGKSGKGIGLAGTGIGLAGKGILTTGSGILTVGSGDVNVAIKKKGKLSSIPAENLKKSVIKSLRRKKKN